MPKDFEPVVWLSIELLQWIMKSGLECFMLSSVCGVALEKWEKITSRIHRGIFKMGIPVEDANMRIRRV